MPIRWDPIQVRKAADDLEALVKEAEAPLAKARAVAEAALSIPDLPQYVTQHIHSLLAEIGRVTGGVNRFSNTPYAGSILQDIERLRADIPKGVLAAAQAASDQQSLL